MNNLSIAKTTFIRLKKLFVCIVYCFACLVLACGLSSCKKTVDYFSYVSELRDNIFLGANETLQLRVYAIKKESPYLTDGIPCEKNVRTELHLCAPAGDKTCTVSFQINGTAISGEMSYDNVKGEYFFAYPISCSELSSIDFVLVYGEETFTISTNSVKEKATLSPQIILNSIIEKETELFSAMTDKYGFTGEIYMRLIYEDAPFYYVGIIERNGNVTAFLLNANTGKILAKR